MEQSGTQVVAVVTTAMTKQVQLGSSSGELWLDAVPRGELELALLTCAPTLLKALESTDEIDFFGLCEMLREERATLLIEYFNRVPQRCAVSTLIEYPRYRAMEILAIGNFPCTRFITADSFELLQVWARRCGAKKLQGFTDEAVGRLWKRLGFYEARRLMRIEL